MTSGENSGPGKAQQPGVNEEDLAGVADASGHAGAAPAGDEAPVSADGNAAGESAAGESAAVGQEQADDQLGFGDARMPGDAGPGGPDLEQTEPDPDDPENLRGQLLESQQQAESHWERVLRMQADMENQRKRAQKDIENARKFSLEGIVNELLPVKDSLEMGLQAASGDDADLEKIVEGSDLTLKMLSQAFEKYNISELNPVDEKFNPELHQAMSQQEVEGKEPNTVINVLQKGYTLNERLIRPALVMVAK